MPRIRRLVGVGALCLIGSGAAAAVWLASAAPAAPVCDNTWVGTTNGDFNTVSNWSLGHIPTAAENACITATTLTSPATATDSYTVTLSGTASVKSLQVGGATGTQTLGIRSNGSS